MNPNLLLAFLGGPDVVLPLAVCLVLLGSRKLPELAGSLGRASRELKSARDSIQSELPEALEPSPRPEERNSRHAASLFGTEDGDLHLVAFPGPEPPAAA